MYFSTHVLSEDTLNREIIQGNTLFTRRILTKTNRVPKWGERFVKSTTVAIVEESYVDRKTKILTTYTRNIGLNRIMVRNSIYDNNNWSVISRLTKFASLMIRASQRKSYTLQTLPTQDTRWQIGWRGSIHKCMGSDEPLKRLAWKGSEPIRLEHPLDLFTYFKSCIPTIRTNSRWCHSTPPPFPVSTRQRKSSKKRQRKQQVKLRDSRPKKFHSCQMPTSIHKYEGPSILFLTCINQLTQFRSLS